GGPPRKSAAMMTVPILGLSHLCNRIRRWLPPVPYNRMFDPEAMPAPVWGDPAIDVADDYLVWMNHAVWAETISPLQARQLRARYFGAIAFVDHCIGQILDAVENRPDADNTLICF